MLVELSAHFVKRDTKKTRSWNKISGDAKKCIIKALCEKKEIPYKVEKYFIGQVEYKSWMKQGLEDESKSKEKPPKLIYSRPKTNTSNYQKSNSGYSKIHHTGVKFDKDYDDYNFYTNHQINHHTTSLFTGGGGCDTGGFDSGGGCDTTSGF